MAQKARSVVDVILGEAKAGDFEDMISIASVIENRARAAGVDPQDVVSVKSEFNAFGKSLPAGVDKYRDLAELALETVRTTGPVHNATFYATPSASKNLPKGLEKETETAGHRFYSDPQARSFKTALGYVEPDPNYAAPPPQVATPMARPDMEYAALDPAVMGEPYNAAEVLASQPENYQPTSLLSGAFDLTTPGAYGRSATARAEPIQGAVIHHAEPATLNALQNVTNSPRQNGAYLGYHLGIDPLGQVGQFAPFDVRTNHVGQVPAANGTLTNRNSIGISLLDAYNPTTPDQIAAAGEAIAAFNRQGDLGFIDPATSISYHGKGHTDHRGVEGMADAAAIQAYMQDLPFGPFSTPTPTPRPDPTVNQPTMVASADPSFVAPQTASFSAPQTASFAPTSLLNAYAEPEAPTSVAGQSTAPRSLLDGFAPQEIGRNPFDTQRSAPMAQPAPAFGVDPNQALQMDVEQERAKAGLADALRAQAAQPLTTQIGTPAPTSAVKGDRVGFDSNRFATPAPIAMGDIAAPPTMAQPTTPPAPSGPASQPQMAQGPSPMVSAGVDRITFDGATQAAAANSSRLASLLDDVQGTRMRNAAIGGILGTIVGGPLGGILGLGLAGRMTNRSPQAQALGYFPSAPSLAGRLSQLVGYDPGNGGYGGLNDYGREAYAESGQFAEAVNSGDAGLW